MAVTDFLRRTPLARLLPAQALWATIADAAIVAHVGNDTALGLMMADLSPLPRLGFKGRDTVVAMKTRFVVLEAEPNRAFRQPDGGLCLVLGTGEVLLLGTLDGTNALAAFEASWQIDDGERSYPIPRRDSHAWLAVAGPAAPAMFAKLCGVDLRPHRFADLAIAQTSMARLNTIVVRADRGDRLTYHLLADSSSAAYLWTCLQDASAEFGGAIVGLGALRS